MEIGNNSFCGNQYSNLWGRDIAVSWTWFLCKRNGQCIHNNTRCDMHPHPSCVYVNENGESVAEDEEGCLEEYKRKGLVAASATLECVSPLHNNDSSSVKANIWNETQYRDIPDETALGSGIMVRILSTRCNGVPECWGDVDELNCGFSTYITLVFGKKQIKR